MEFKGNVVMNSPRFGIVAHNSRVQVVDNIIVAADGTGILLEDGTETGDVKNNLIIGNGGGTGKGDQFFTTSNGTDFGQGGFGIWSRTIYSAIEENIAEGVFGMAPYAYFVHINFMKDRTVPDVEGTPEALVGKTRVEVESELNDYLTLQSYGSFKGNSAFGSWRSALSMTYWFGTSAPGGHVVEDFVATALTSSGNGMSFSFSSTHTLQGGSFTANEMDNTIVGISCGNGNLNMNDTDYTFNNVAMLYDGCLAE